MEIRDPDSLVTIGTGGMASLLKDEHVFDVYLPNLVLDGLRIAVEMNKKELEK
jgi:pantothenate kinase type III